MVVDFEFFDKEPIENVVTPMNYAVDKVVFFGWEETDQRLKQSIERFLIKYCSVKTVNFVWGSKNNPEPLRETIRKTIKSELEVGNEIYFDLTGGDSMVSALFGTVVAEFDVPIHMYDIRKNKLIEIESKKGDSISKKVKKRQLKYDLDMMVRLHGGIINEKGGKSFKGSDDEESIKDLQNLWAITERYSKEWNAVSAFLRAHQSVRDCETVFKSTELMSQGSQIRQLGISESEIKTLFHELNKAGLISRYLFQNGIYQIRYKNSYVQNLICETGSVLEKKVFLDTRKIMDDCKIGVHIDWDGVVHRQTDEDIVNEVDVLALDGYIPVFISCKCGKVYGNTGLYALYELETIARQFGGKYVRKILAVVQNPGKVNTMRAKEMGIEIRRI